MIYHILLYLALGYLCVKLPVTIFAYMPWLRDRVHRVPLLLGSIALLTCGLMFIALTH